MRKLAFALILLLTLQASFSQSKRLALVIGNGNYLHAGILANPENDARAMHNSLTALGFDVLKYENLSQDEMRKAIDDFGDKLKEYDVGLVYYAGHGIQAKRYNYLIPTNAQLSSENDVEYQCVRADRILAKMEDAGNSTNVLILDACRNNPFERSWTRAASGRGLTFMNAPTGSLIAFATQPGNTASDGKGRNGLYTSALLTFFGEPNQNILQAFQKVRTYVRENSNGDQVPWESTSLEGDFYLNESDQAITPNSNEDVISNTSSRYNSKVREFIQITNFSEENNSITGTVNKGGGDGIVLGKKYYIHLPKYNNEKNNSAQKIIESQIIGEISISSYEIDQAFGQVNLRKDTVIDISSLDLNDLVLFKKKKAQFSVGTTLFLSPRISLSIQSHRNNPYQKVWYGIGVAYFIPDNQFIPDLEIGTYIHPYRINRFNTGIKARLRWSKVTYNFENLYTYLFGPGLYLHCNWKILYFDVGAFYMQDSNNINGPIMPDVGVGLAF